MRYKYLRDLANRFEMAICFATSSECADKACFSLREASAVGMRILDKADPYWLESNYQAVGEKHVERCNHPFRLKLNNIMHAALELPDIGCQSCRYLMTNASAMLVSLNSLELPGCLAIAKG
jgi:hypothetical protein